MTYSPAEFMSDGTYNYDVTSPWWNDVCSQLPCSLKLAWPGYVTQMVEVTLRGEPAVIQLWKGWCQSLPDIPGVVYFPGGVGAEVGIYRRDRTRQVPTTIPGLPDGVLGDVAQFLRQRLADVAAAGSGPDEIWWPAPELVDPDVGVSMTLSEPETHDALLTYGTRSYWTCKWMHMVPSYPIWTTAFSFRHFQGPALYTDFVLDFTVNGEAFQWAGSDGPIVRR
jgi:hypothetical protein